MGILDERMAELETKELLKCYEANSDKCKNCPQYEYCPMFQGGRA